MKISIVFKTQYNYNKIQINKSSLSCVYNWLKRDLFQIRVIQLKSS